MPVTSTDQRYVTEADIRVVWRCASGPKGERDPSAVPLYEAIFAGDQKAVIAQLDKGVSPNALLYPKKWSPLIVAISLQDRAMIDLLLKRGADINYVSAVNVGHTSLQVALFTDDVVFFESHGNIPKNYYPMINYILDRGADINIVYPYGDDIAITATDEGNMELVNDLLARGYHRELRKLKQTLNIRIVSPDRQAEKEQALATIGQLLKEADYSANKPPGGN